MNNLSEPAVVYQQTPIAMEAITIRYDKTNRVAHKLLKEVLSTGYYEIEEKPYNEDFVAKINRSRASEGKVINTADLWK